MNNNSSLYLLPFLILLSSSSFNLCAPDAILQTGSSLARAVQLSSDHQYMIVGSHDNSTYVFKFNGTIFEQSQVLSEPEGNVISVAINYDHTTIVAGTLDLNTYVYEKGSEGSFSLNQKIYNQGVVIFSTALSKDGSFLAVGDDHGKPKIYEKQDGQFRLIQTIERSAQASGYIKSVTFSQDARFLAVGYFNGVIAIYEFKQKFEKEQIITDISNPITALSIVAGNVIVDGTLAEANDQYHLVAASENNTYIFIHETGVYTLNQTLSESGEQIYGVVLDPHKKYLAVASSDNMTYIYNRNASNGQYQQYQVLDDAADFCLGVSFDEAAEYLAVASADSFVRVYHSLRIYEYEDRQHVYVQTGESLIGIGILIGIIIGVIATLIGVFLYFKFRKPENQGEEVISEGTFNNNSGIKKEIDEKVMEESMKAGNDDGTVEENLEVSKVQDAKKVELFRMEE